MKLKNNSIDEIMRKKNDILKSHRTISKIINTTEVSKEYTSAPIVFLISGPGGGGKDTFIEYVDEYVKHHKNRQVLNISTINPVKRGVECILDHNTHEGEIDVKSDKYRSFLHDVKEAWVKYNNGPTEYIKDIIKYNINTNNKPECMIFVHCREGNEIDKLIETVQNEIGLIVLSIGVFGHVDPESFTNAADKNSDYYSYDYKIYNTQDLEDLKEKAYNFAKFILIANDLYGIQV